MRRIKQFHFLLLLLLSAIFSWSQTITIQNRSFETGHDIIDNVHTEWWPVEIHDTTWRTRTLADGGEFGYTPPPWGVCSQTPDLLPLTASGVNISKAAPDGDWYLGLVCDLANAGVSESIGQPLSAPFVPNIPYNFSVWLSHSASGYAQWGLTQPGKMQIWASMSQCGATELLWESPLVDHEDWREYEIDFTPTQAWDHIYFTMPSCPSGKTNILIDHISGIEPGGLRVTSPAASSTLPCGHTITGKSDEKPLSVLVSGAFKNSPVSAVIATDYSWSADVEYDKSFSGTDYITVIADYEANLVPNDTIIVPVNIVATSPDYLATTSFVTQPAQFQDQSTSYPETSVEFSWDFGDGQSSTDQNPSHLYSTPGTYTVTETITYGSFSACTDVISKEIMIPEKPGELKITEPAPGASTTPNCVHTIKGWTNYKADSITVSGSVVGHPLATYTSDTTWEMQIFFPGDASGTQTVLATAWFPANSAIDSASLEVQTSATADFTFQSNSPWSPVQFTDQSSSITGSISDWSWNFGDGLSSSEQNPSHTWTATGTHPVTLTVTSSADGCKDDKTINWDIPTLTPADSGHLFEDTDHDGTLDRISLIFSDSLTSDMIQFLKLQFRWPDTSGKSVEFQSQNGDLYADPENPTHLIWDLSNEHSLAPMITSIGIDYGEAWIVQDTGATAEELKTPLNMTDVLPPFIVDAQIFMSTKPEVKPDTLKIVFSESMNYTDAPNDQLFEFFLHSTNASDVLSYSTDSWNPRIGWQKKGTVLVVLFDAELEGNMRPFPGDSLRMQVSKDLLTDLAGNTGVENTAFIPIRGTLRAGIESNYFVEISDSDFTNANSFGVPALFEQSESLKSASNGQLGAFVTLTIPETDSAGNAPNAEDIEWNYSVQYFTNIGNYVASTNGTLKCTDALFSEDGNSVGNCLESPLRKLFIPWQYRSESGRLVGTGAYIQKVRFDGKSYPAILVGVQRK